MSNRYTLRGVLAGGGRKTILDDELTGQGWVVERFTIWPNDMDALTPVSAKLFLQRTEGGSLQYSDAGDNRAIGWAMYSVSHNYHSVLDPEHMIIDSLDVINMSATNSLAYLVELKRISISSDQAIISLIKERSQEVV